MSESNAADSADASNRVDRCDESQNSPCFNNLSAAGGTPPQQKAAPTALFTLPPTKAEQRYAQMNGRGDNRLMRSSFPPHQRSVHNKYFDELTWELREMDMAEQNPVCPVTLPHARGFLVRELMRLRHPQLSDASASPPQNNGTSLPSLLDNIDVSPQAQNASNGSGSSYGRPSGGYDNSGNGRSENPQSIDLGRTNVKLADGSWTAERRWKIFMPDHPTYNFIGRILGPRGISVRRLEADTECTILIRGRGCVKDQQREDSLRNVAGWEHLKEPLHVLLIAQDANDRVCADKLRTGVSAVEQLLKPRYDDYKRQQLVQLAIISGNYRPVE